MANPGSSAGERGPAEIVVEPLQNGNGGSERAKARSYGKKQVPDDALIDPEHAVIKVNVLIEEVAPFRGDRDEIQLIRLDTSHPQHYLDGLARKAHHHLLASKPLLVDSGDDPTILDNGGAADKMIADS